MGSVQCKLCSHLGGSYVVACALKEADLLWWPSLQCRREWCTWGHRGKSARTGIHSKIGNGKGQWGQLCVCICIDRRLNASMLVYVWLWWCITHLLYAAVGSLNDHFTEVVSNSHMVGCLWTAGVCDRPTYRGRAEQATTWQGSQHGCHVCANTGFNNTVWKWEHVYSSILTCTGAHNTLLTTSLLPCSCGYVNARSKHNHIFGTIEHPSQCLYTHGDNP